MSELTELDKSVTAESPSVVRLAQRLQRDMRRRSLREGDYYLSAAEVATHFGVSPMMANRAMNLLAERQWLRRYRSRGSFVGPKYEQEMSAKISTVYYLSFADVDPSWQAPVGAMVAGMRREIPNGQIQVHMVHGNDVIRHLRQELDRITADPSFAGIVLGFSPCEVQRYLTSSGLPVVVQGEVFSGVDLPCVCADQKQVGRLFVQEAVDAGCRRLALFLQEEWHAGNNLLLDGILEAIQVSGLGAAAFRVRDVPMDLQHYEAVVGQRIQELLDESDEPTALLCRNNRIAEMAVKQIERIDIVKLPPLAVIYNAVPLYQRVESAICRCVTRCCSVEDEFAIIGRMLRQHQQNQSPSPKSVVLPVARG